MTRGLYWHNGHLVILVGAGWRSLCGRVGDKCTRKLWRPTLRPRRAAGDCPVCESAHYQKVSP